MRSGSTPEQRKLWRLLDAASKRQAEMRREDDQPVLSDRARAIWEKYRRLLATVDQVEQRLDAKEKEIEAMAHKRPLEFAADVDTPFHDQPKSIDRIKDKGSDNGNGNGDDKFDRLLAAIDQIGTRLSKLEGTPPIVTDEDDDLDDQMQDIAAKAKKGDADPDDKPTPPLAVPGARGDSFAERRNRCLEVQADLDPVYASLGIQAPPPMAAEARRAYMIRLLNPLQRFDSAWAKIDLGKLSGDALKVAADSIKRSALVEASAPTNIPAGKLREVVSRSDSGHTVRRYYAQPGSGATRGWLTPNQPLRLRNYVTAINRNPGYHPSATA